MPLEIEFQVLSPVRALINGEELAVGGRRHQVLLAVLLIHLGNPVEADRLIDALWAEDPPASAGSTLRTHLSRIRLIQIFENDVAGMEGAMSRLGEERAHGLVAEGRVMSIDEAVGYALSER